MQRTHQLETAPERMNDEFSRHLSAAMYSLIKEIVTAVVAEMKEKNPEPPQPSTDSQEYMTRKEVMALLKRCDSTIETIAKVLDTDPHGTPYLNQQPLQDGQES